MPAAAVPTKSAKNPPSIPIPAPKMLDSIAASIGSAMIHKRISKMIIPPDKRFFSSFLTTSFFTASSYDLL